MHKTPTSAFVDLAPLFFKTRQLIRSKLPHTSTDPNEWMRCEALRCVRARTPAPTMREVADYLRIKAPSATSVIIRLEREGLVSRIREKDDMRIVRITLTRKGEKRVEKYLSDATTTMGKVFSKISKKDVMTLTRILRSLQRAHEN